MQNVYLKDEINLVCSKLKKIKTDFSDFVIISEKENCLYSVLNNCFQNTEIDKAKDFCVIGILYGAVNKEKLLDEIEQAVLNKGCKRCIICDENSIEPKLTDFLVAEREYLFLAKDKTAIEKSKNFLKKVHTTVLIFDEIISPDFGLIKELDFNNDLIRITDEDLKSVQGFTYIRDALSAVLMSLSTLDNGNIYNVSSFYASICDIKKKAHELFSEKFSLNCNISSPKETLYKMLCPLKIQNEGLDFTDFSQSIFLIVSARFNMKYDYHKSLTQYCRKLEMLKSAEIIILSEIDRICKKHNIKYFLTGGTLLGAVRYNKMIPWDDDIDIGMLRADFEKFRRVCPDEIDKSKFVYSSYSTEKNCHYLFDKIRLKNTYFSTKFASNFKIQNGAFVDVLVYDETSISPKKQKLHINLIKTAIRFLNIKWTGKADRSMNGYLLSLLVKPILKFVSFDKIHAFSEKVLQLYNKKKSGLLIDGTGLNINRGAFKKSWLEETVEIDFEGVKAPIPKNYDEFLSHVYGKDYIEEPPLEMRLGTHDFVRFDLGEFVNGDVELIEEQSLDGELY